MFRLGNEKGKWQGVKLGLRIVWGNSMSIPLATLPHQTDAAGTRIHHLRENREVWIFFFFRSPSFRFFSPKEKPKKEKKKRIFSLSGFISLSLPHWRIHFQVQIDESDCTVVGLSSYSMSAYRVPSVWGRTRWLSSWCFMVNSGLDGRISLLCYLFRVSNSRRSSMPDCKIHIPW